MTSSLPPDLERASAPAAPEPASDTKPRSFRKRLIAAIAQRLALLLVHLVGYTLRFRVPVRAEYERIRQQYPGPFIFALFHGPHFPILYFWRHKGLCVVTSRSSDGQILTNILHGLGYRTVRGSSSRGGTAAMIGLAHMVKDQSDVAIAVDGPRGPVHEVKAGVALLSKLTGRPVLPVAACPGRFIQFASWDLFRLPIPFTTATLSVAEPVTVPADVDDAGLEACRLQIQQRLLEAQQKLDEQVQPRIWKLSKRKKRSKPGVSQQP